MLLNCAIPTHTVLASGFFPDANDLLRLALLQDYNTRLVVLSTALLGLASGLVGSFLLLRKRSLMGDALSHAMYPGIVLAFIVAVALGGSGRSLPVLLGGAVLTGLLGCAIVLAVRHLTRIKDDAAMGIVLSVFFGGGVVLMGFAQNMPQAAAAGLDAFLYGKTAAMLWSDFQLVSGIAVISLIASLMLFKEFRLLCFDEDFARAMGWPVVVLDVLMLLLVTCVTVVGLQAVGVVLIIAFLIIPAASARLWTSRFSNMLLLAAGFGGISGWLGASVSGLSPGLPAGAVIVLTAATIFVVSLIFGSERGLVLRLLRARTLARRVQRQHLLRAMYECIEEANTDNGAFTFQVPWRVLQLKRSWSQASLRRIARRAYREGLLESPHPGGVCMTEAGARAAARITRNHRLWEIYLMDYADIAPSHVDRDADAIEHILGPELIRKLEQSLPLDAAAVPASPHPLRKHGNGVV